MGMNRILRGIAGTFILISLLLAVVHSYWWLLFTAFVGANLLQSAFTDSCPMMKFLEWFGMQKETIQSSSSGDTNRAGRA